MIIRYGKIGGSNNNKHCNIFIFRNIVNKSHTLTFYYTLLMPKVKCNVNCFIYIAFSLPPFWQRRFLYCHLEFHSCFVHFKMHVHFSSSLPVCDWINMKHFDMNRYCYASNSRIPFNSIKVENTKGYSKKKNQEKW